MVRPAAEPAVADRRLATRVAAASRALAVAGLFDMNGHLSIRSGDLMHIQDRVASRISVRPEDIAVVRIADGGVLEGSPPSEAPLHLAVYRARPDAGSVAHFHPLHATAFAVAERPLVTAFNAGAVFGESVPVYDEPDLVRDDVAGRAFAAVLGSGRAALLRGHGALVVGEDVASCVALALYLEESARRLAAAAALGKPRPFTKDEVVRVGASLRDPEVVRKAWLDAIERARLAGVLEGLDRSLLD